MSKRANLKMITRIYGAGQLEALADYSPEEIRESEYRYERSLERERRRRQGPPEPAPVPEPCSYEVE